MFVSRGTQAYKYSMDMSTQTEKQFQEMFTQTENSFSCTERHNFIATILAKDFFEEKENLKRVFKKAFTEITTRIANEVNAKYAAP